MKTQFLIFGLENNKVGGNYDGIYIGPDPAGNGDAALVEARKSKRFIAFYRLRLDPADATPLPITGDKPVIVQAPKVIPKAVKPEVAEPQPDVAKAENAIRANRAKLMKDQQEAQQRKLKAEADAKAAERAQQQGYMKVTVPKPEEQKQPKAVTPAAPVLPDAAPALPTQAPPVPEALPVENPA